MTNRYDMPVVFGPSTIPDQTHVPDAEVVMVSFVTEEHALLKLLPPGFELGAEPLLNLSFIEYNGVDYLGGRGYQEVVVSCPARLHTRYGELQAGCPIVLWVSDVGALISGREFMGLPKLIGTFDVERRTETRDFSCREYDNILLTGAVEKMAPLPAEQLEKLRARASEVRTFGWKHIPGPDGSVDLAYPLLNVMRWNYSEAWTGDGRVTFSRPDSQSAPFSSRIAAALGQLPVKAWRRAFVGRGSAIIDRAATRRIEMR